MKTALDTEVAIIGAGISGSLISAMLHKAGIDHLMIDPRTEYPKEFRCEKFNTQQIELMKKTGVAEDVFKAITPVKDVWMARFGRLVRKQSYPHYGFSYQTVVNALRKNLNSSKKFIQGTVCNITPSSQSQLIVLKDETEITARLVVLASGANQELHKHLGLKHTLISERHCLAIGFDVEPAAGSEFAFDTMTYWPETQSDKMSYLTFFRIDDGWRANFFGYWNIRDDKIKELKSEPEKCLHSLMPGLEGMVGKFRVLEGMRIRPIDLYQWEIGDLEGVVAVGDAWSSSCPGAGTGTTKAINDALQLCQTHIPQWLSTPGMGAQKISRFYRDIEKSKIDQSSRAEAFKLRSLTLSKSPYWQLQRWARFVYHGLRGKLAAG